MMMQLRNDAASIAPLAVAYFKETFASNAFLSRNSPLTNELMGKNLFSLRRMSS